MVSRRDFLGSAAAAGGLAAIGSLASGAETQPGEAPALVLREFGKNELPPLPYPYEALEPHISAEILRLHHDRHHAAYVKGLNEAEVALAEARIRKDFSQVDSLARAVAFHGSGHINHSIYWDNMRPGGPPGPPAPLAARIKADFGSMEAFKEQFTATAAKVEANGWAALVWSPLLKRLHTLAMLNHQNSHMTGAVTLLIVDVWEHAYYLKYQNRRPEYLAAWWNLVNWDDVAARFAAAVKL